MNKHSLIDSMINLATALRENDPELYYYYVECLRDLYNFAEQNDLPICPADLWN